VREASAADAQQSVTAATSEALTIVANAQTQADQLMVEAEQAKTAATDDARAMAGEAWANGAELIDNLREMSDSLRSNAERLLRDIQSLHSHMLAQIDRAEGSLGGSPDLGAAETARGEDRTEQIEVDELEIPEFIPAG
jgi:hypothetical protein